MRDARIRPGRDTRGSVVGRDGEVDVEDKTSLRPGVLAGDRGNWAGGTSTGSGDTQLGASDKELGPPDFLGCVDGNVLRTE